MKIVKQIILILTATVLMLVSQLSHSRHAALLIDADNGNVLYELEANQAWYPASLTKLMTLYMTFAALESGRLTLNTRMNVSSHAARQPTSKLGLRTWDSISVEDAILAIITRSANDAAVVLAEQLAGSEERFALVMTSTAHSLGMYGSHFMNATGLPHDWQTTTAHDMALLAWKISRNFSQYYPYFAAGSLYFNGREYRGINKFVANYPGAEGMKTGYTCGSGFNLVASANQQGKRLIGVILGGMTSSERYQHMFDMMDTGFSDSYGSNHSRNINSMSKDPVGTPPYQLSCGHRPSSYFAARHIEADDDDHQVRYVRRTSHITHHYASNARTETSRRITKIRIAGKTKTIVKHISEPHHVAKSNKSNHNVSKSSNKTKVAVTSRKTGKQATKTEKVIQVAKAGSNGKGYYAATSKSKKATTSSGSKKNNGYYKPDNSKKTVTKSKRNTRKKS